MPPAPPRRLNLGDGMILIAGVALAMSLTQIYRQASFFEPMSPYPGNLVIGVAWGNYYLAWAARVAMIWLAVFSLAFLVIRLRQPRPSRSRVFRQAGASASLIATVLVVVELLLWLMAAAINRRGFTLFFDAIPFQWRIAPAGAGVAAVWTCAWFTRRWQPERSTIDFGGRILGVGWIVVFLIMTGTKTLELLGVHLTFLDNSPPTAAAFEQQQQADDAAYQKYAQQMRQYHQDQRAYLDRLSQSKDPKEIATFLTSQIQALEQERANFEGADKARGQATQNPFVLPTPPLPLPPDVPRK